MSHVKEVKKRRKLPTQVLIGEKEFFSDIRAVNLVL
jgi:hypothetical protein